ncbi:MAG: hypothetical protein KH240_12445, partial [Faecalibacterium prausnitzii]|nr:hypothetical protein [Faecalibacterium prausnitzii]
QIKTKRPEPCAIQDSDRWGRLIRFLSNFWGSYHRPAGGFCLCRETTNCGKKNRNADKVHKNVPKSLAGCTENGKTPAETISAKKFCRGYVKKSFPEFPGRTDLYSF